MYALGNPGTLEDCFRQAGFLNLSVQAASIPRRFQSAAAAVENMKKAAVDIREFMNRLNEAAREQAWAEIEEQFRSFDGPNGVVFPGEVLVGVGMK
jgi:hypothetical protein